MGIWNMGVTFHTVTFFFLALYLIHGKRLQQINGDTVLEITEEEPDQNASLSKYLLRQKEYLEQSIATFQITLADVMHNLA